MDTTDLKNKVESAFGDPEREVAVQVWKELKKHIIPSKTSDFIGSKPREQTNVSKGLYDSTAINAADNLASFINYGTTSGSKRWARLCYNDKDLENHRESRRFLNSIEDILFDYINKSNFYEEMSKAYLSFVALGSLAIYVDVVRDQRTNEFRNISFKTLPLESISWEEDTSGEINTIYQKTEYTYAQIREKFGNLINTENFPSQSKKCFSRIIIETSRINEEIIPEEYRDFKYVGLIIDDESTKIIQITGFRTFPIMVSRWSTLPGNVYGRGPGHLALPDIKSVNLLKEMTLIASYKAISPPYLTTERDLVNLSYIKPNQLLHVRDMAGLRRLEDPVRYDVAQLGLLELQQTIRSAFYSDKLIPQEGDGQFFGAAQRTLQPIVSGLNKNVLNRIVYRGLDILEANRRFPDIPEPTRSRLGGALSSERSLRIEFMNSFSQKAEKAQSVLDWIATLNLLAQSGFPEVLDNVNPDEAARIFSELRKIDPAVMRDEDEIAAIREQRAMAQEQQRVADIANKIADAASKTEGRQ